MSTRAYCEEKGAPAGSTAYYRRLFAPAESQAAITALYALAAEVRAIPDDVSEPGAARMKLAWWQAELQRLFEGNPGHPVTRELAAAVERHGLTRDRFESLVALADVDIEHPGYADADALLERATRAADLQRIETEICGYEHPDTAIFSERLGIALELSRIVRDLRVDAAQGRIHVPADALQAHGVRPGDLLQPQTGTGVRALLSERLRHARDQLVEAERALPDMDRRRQASGLVAARLEQTLLAEIERDGYRVLEHRVTLTPLRKFWVAWRTARRARRKAHRARGNP